MPKKKTVEKPVETQPEAEVVPEVKPNIMVAKEDAPTEQATEEETTQTQPQKTEEPEPEETLPPDIFLIDCPSLKHKQQYSNPEVTVITKKLVNLLGEGEVIRIKRIS